MSILKEFILVLIVAVIFIFGFSFYVCIKYIKPPRFVSEITPEKAHLTPFEKIDLTTEDNINIKGWFMPAHNKEGKAIIVCHGYPMDKGNVLDLASIFYKDYSVLLFDFRGMGESGGNYTTLGLNEVKDFNEVIKEVSE